PVDVDAFTPAADSVGEYFLLVSAMVPYKRDDLAVQVLTERGLPLVVVGDGPERRRLQRLANGRAKFLGRLDGTGLIDCYRRARALLYPGEEDFGITPVEANACGRPVIAFKAGGVLETQIDGQTAVLFDRQDAAGLSEALDRFEKSDWKAAAIREHAVRFSRTRFQEAIGAHILETWEDFVSNGRERPDLVP
ncbi:MAG: glycosyltransferase, partial [Candidatus Riflebacteria bacterium]|nr:glycosyltransferase [Candidatus Riflebacteria bacterium]